VFGQDAVVRPCLAAGSNSENFTKRKIFMFKSSVSAVLAMGILATPALAEARANRAICPAVTSAAVEQQFTKFNAAWATKDPATVTALFSRDAVLLPTLSNTPRTTHAAINDYFVKFLKGSPVGTIDTSTIKIDCKTASRVGTWTVSLTNGEGLRSDVKARYSFIYTWENGAWKIDHLHSSVMPEAVASH
jgi:uncharacterized protein (TIGR02246 family)